jgi:hypothetical protein
MSLIGVSYFMMVRSERQTQMAIPEIHQFMEKRTEVVKTLLYIAKQKIKSKPTEAAWAIKLLGELKAIEATDFLLDNITFQNPYVDEPTDLYPAMVALILIGYPSVRGIVYNGFKRERSDLEQKLMAHVICSVLGDGYRNPLKVGRRLGRLIIQEHLRSANPPKQVRERLIKFMENYFPAEKPIKRH